MKETPACVAQTLLSVLPRQECLGHTITACLLFLLAATAQAITVEDYARSLDRMRALLAEKQIEKAHAEATALIGAEVDGFKADDTLLRAVIEATTPDVRMQSRLAITAAELRAASSGAFAEADRKLLAQLEKQQSVKPLTPGGEIFSDAVTDASVWTRVSEITGKVIDWILEKLGKFYDWLRKFWPDVKWIDKPTSGIRWIVAVVVVLIAAVIGVLAFEVIRRSRRRPTDVAAESEPIASARDADPLSRGANEWERYAAQLAAAGRIREAIRAWYHAVLVTLYGAGILSFRKGRTNWEYISALTPSLAWRGEFVTLTRRFEQEWYGSERSVPEALTDCRASARQILNQVRPAGESE